MVASAEALASWGLQPDDRVRWRPTGKRAWVEARVTGIEGDGSVACVDADGRARAVVASRCGGAQAGTAPGVGSR
jgi:hypothetical protein